MLCFPHADLTLYSTILVFRIYYHANWINSSQSTKSYWKRGLEVLPHQTKLTKSFLHMETGRQM